jgi:hypothetical protein
LYPDGNVSAPFTIATSPPAPPEESDVHYSVRVTGDLDTERIRYAPAGGGPKTTLG